MFIVYVLRDKNGKFYKGMTGDLIQRMIGHLSGNTKTTRRMEQLKVVYTEEFMSSIEARRREKYFKSAAGRKYLKKVIVG